MTTNKFQCSPTSRVGVNVLGNKKPRLPKRGFSALRRAVLGSILQECSLSSRHLGFQCSPTSRVGVNCFVSGEKNARGARFSALRRAVLGSIQAQPIHKTTRPQVSVLSDEPCWGQLTLFIALAARSAVSVLSDEPCWGQCPPSPR